MSFAERAGVPGRGLLDRVNRRLAYAGMLANALGALIVALFLGFLAPGTVDPDDFDELLIRNGVAFLVYMPVTLLIGRELVGRRPFMRLSRWLVEERPASERERLLALRYPLSWALGSAVPWAGAALLFSLLNLSASLTVAISVGVTILLGGATACALQYLLVERLIRPITAAALAGGRPPRGATPGVAARITMAWTLATAVPLLGVLAFAVGDLTGADFDPGALVGATLFLTVLALAAGLAGMLFAARSVSDPLVTVAKALERLEGGDLEATVPVEDGSEVGVLQAGYNRMLAGLNERERLREAFGAFVDPELTERVLVEGTDLAGEEVELSVMFLDVRDFTGFAERADAREVVARLNELYEVVVPILLRHGGHASKFVGDGLLAVFGAPERLPDHAERAVAAALEVAATVRERCELRVGVGVNSGRVVAGTVGGGGRLDFTVIGDAVNVAARVEAATRETGDDVLITEATRDSLAGGAGRWRERPAIPLRGRREPIRLYGSGPAG